MLENQIAYYWELKQSNPDYEYVGVYSDFVISGYKEKDPGLQQMLADARARKIDFVKKIDNGDIDIMSLYRAAVLKIRLPSGGQPVWLN